MRLTQIQIRGPAEVRDTRNHGSKYKDLFLKDRWADWERQFQLALRDDDFRRKDAAEKRRFIQEQIKQLRDTKAKITAQNVRDAERRMVENAKLQEQFEKRRLQAQGRVTESGQRSVSDTAGTASSVFSGTGGTAGSGGGRGRAADVELLRGLRMPASQGGEGFSWAEIAGSADTPSIVQQFGDDVERTRSIAFEEGIRENKNLISDDILEDAHRSRVDRINMQGLQMYNAGEIDIDTYNNMVQQATADKEGTLEALARDAFQKDLERSGVSRDTFNSYNRYAQGVRTPDDVRGGTRQSQFSRRTQGQTERVTRQQDRAPGRLVQMGEFEPTDTAAIDDEIMALQSLLGEQFLPEGDVMQDARDRYAKYHLAPSAVPRRYDTPLLKREQKRQDAAQRRLFEMEDPDLVDLPERDETAVAPPADGEVRTPDPYSEDLPLPTDEEMERERLKQEIREKAIKLRARDGDPMDEGMRILEDQSRAAEAGVDPEPAGTRRSPDNFDNMPFVNDDNREQMKQAIKSKMPQLSRKQIEELTDEQIGQLLQEAQRAEEAGVDPEPAGTRRGEYSSSDIDLEFLDSMDQPQDIQAPAEEPEEFEGFDMDDDEATRAISRYEHLILSNDDIPSNKSLRELRKDPDLIAADKDIVITQMARARGLHFAKHGAPRKLKDSLGARSVLSLWEKFDEAGTHKMRRLVGISEEIFKQFDEDPTDRDYVDGLIMLYTLHEAAKRGLDEVKED